MNDNIRHVDVRALVDEATKLDDPRLESLSDAIRAELARRETIRGGLDVGERLQFDTLIDLVRERTQLSEDDALTVIRAHKPGRVRGAS